MRVTVCELSDDRDDFGRDWEALVEHVQERASGLVLLPELIFSQWFAESAEFDADVWQRALDENNDWMNRLGELAPATVLGSRPVETDGLRLNEGFIYTPDGTYIATHHKTYLPNDEGYWEANWFNRAPKEFEPALLGFVQIGFTICTEIWFMEHARDYGQDGVSIIAAPRCTGSESRDKWLAGGQAAAVISGAYHLSSNRSGRGQTAGVMYGGTGWIIDPDGKVLARTSHEQPFVTVDINLAAADAAKNTYPRYVDAS